MSKNYVARSTEESRKNLVISRLAIMESIFFVAIAGGIAYYYDFYIHIYIAIGIAFFSFLKTPESTEGALSFFFFAGRDADPGDVVVPIFLFIIIFPIIYFFNVLDFIPLSLQIISLVIFVLLINISVTKSREESLAEKDTNSIASSIIFSIILYICVLIYFFYILDVIPPSIQVIGLIIGILTMSILLDKSGGKSLFKFLLPVIDIVDFLYFIFKKIAGILVGLVYIIPIKILRYLVLIPLLPLILLVEGVCALITVFKSILIKVSFTLYFTIKHPVKAFSNIAKNSRELLFVNDIFYSPELIKGIHKYKKELDKDDWSIFKLGHYQLSAIVGDIKNIHFMDLFKSIMLAFILFLQYGYYFLIKSTAWLFFPLVFLSKRKEVKE